MIDVRLVLFMIWISLQPRFSSLDLRTRVGYMACSGNSSRSCFRAIYPISSKYFYLHSTTPLYRHTGLRRKKC
uniref:Secreted protein n=1 Tax=Phakopsora pachyrhizi TaxID=170000 RepID=A0A0S1MJ31_PHAPC